MAGVDIILTYHPHTMALDGFYEPAMTFVALSGIDLFIQIFEPFRGKKEVIAVSTDAGGAKFTVHFANAMDITYAITSKFRDHQGKADLLGVVGDIEGKRVALVTDDETVTGSSILKTVETLHDRYGIEETHVAISHAKLDRGEPARPRPSPREVRAQDAARNGHGAAAVGVQRTRLRRDPRACAAVRDDDQPAPLQPVGE